MILIAIASRTYFLGSGKSVFLNALRDTLKLQKLQVAMTATTGMAATVLDGTTLHRFFGIVDSSLNSQQLADLAVQDQHNFSRIR